MEMKKLSPALRAVAFLKPDGWQVGTFVIASLVAVPLLVLLLSFAHPEKEIWNHIAETLLGRLLGNTALLVLGVGCCTLLLGVGLAWLTATCAFPGRDFFSWALLLPMAIPTYVLAFVFIGIMDFSGPVQALVRSLCGPGVRLPEIRSAGGVILVMSLALYPYVYLLSKSGFESQGGRAMEAARIMGCSTMAGFFRVALPMARPWIAGGVLLVVMETLADFGAVAIFNFDTFTTAIYKAWFGFFSLAAAAQLSSVLVLIVFCLLELEQRSRQRLRYTQAERQLSPARRLRLAGGRAWLAGGACTLVWLMAFALPVIQLLLWSVEVYGEELSRRYLDLLVNSLLLAGLAAVVTVASAFVPVYTRRRHPGPLTRFMVRIATLGYGLPGTVLAVGIFIPVAAVDNFIIDSSRALLGMEVRPLLQGSIGIMVLAYLSRFLAAGFKALDSAMHRITPSIDEAARLMGLGGLCLVRRVHLPLLKGGVMTGLILVFIDVMKELPITLMTRPFGWDTLAVKIFELTSEGEWARAALPALTLVGAGLLPIVFLMRRSES
jgi:iron(III) transport system permease protein